MKPFIYCLLFILSLNLVAQEDQFIGNYIRTINEESYETIVISEADDCYSGTFGIAGAYNIDLVDITIECFTDDEEGYFFLVLSWDDLEFKINPLEWEENGLIASFELISSAEFDEPSIFSRVYE